MKSIERSFPSELIDDVAEMESWRKEVNRPIYHIHKWWAKRLGSVFRAILLGVSLEDECDVASEFYQKHRLSDMTILDPFMGSGTTLGESIKLGIRPIGCDINPVSTFIVRQALTQVDSHKLISAYHEIEAKVSEKIKSFYKTIDPITDSTCDALYYFWVKVVTTPDGNDIPLFSNYIFSKNAYPKKKPEAKILCPSCWTVLTDRYDTTSLQCSECLHQFNPQVGPAQKQLVTDEEGHTYKIKELVSKADVPPHHKMYAVLALTHNGEKVYLPARKFDLDLYEAACETLKNSAYFVPSMSIRDGHNTSQAKGYHYTKWKDFFNGRQLLCLGILLDEILKIENDVIKDHFICLFSSTLEFNNMFCSFKGEGTGAVRHMFSNHILKPERTPLENSVWGTHKSSGVFSTLFKSRLLRAKKYLQEPFELRVQMETPPKRKRSHKEVCSDPIDVRVTETYEDFIQGKNTTLLLNGDSSSLPIPDECVDAVVTDPPYFDFVHYSELSDFFFSWIAPCLAARYPFFNKDNSSDENEVQSKSSQEFSTKLTKVFQECFRVVKPEGLLVFSFHHSRPEGWLSIYNAIQQSKFYVVAAHPVKGEMSVGKPKSSSKNPINLDAILICKKIESPPTQSLSTEEHVWNHSLEKYTELSQSLIKQGRSLSNGDKGVILASQILVHSSLAMLPEETTLKLLLKLYKDSTASFFSTLEENDTTNSHLRTDEPSTQQFSFSFE